MSRFSRTSSHCSRSTHCGSLSGGKTKNINAGAKNFNQILICSAAFVTCFCDIPPCVANGRVWMVPLAILLSRFTHTIPMVAGSCLLDEEKHIPCVAFNFFSAMPCARRSSQETRRKHSCLIRFRFSESDGGVERLLLLLQAKAGSFFKYFHLLFIPPPLRPLPLCVSPFRVVLEMSSKATNDMLHQRLTIDVDSNYFLPNSLFLHYLE